MSTTPVMSKSLLSKSNAIKNNNTLKSSMSSLKESILVNKMSKDYEALCVEIKRLESKVEELQAENDENKEIIHYINLEKEVQEEEKKETEDKLMAEIENNQQLQTQIKDLQIELDSKINIIHELEKQIESSIPLEKYAKHRNLFQENQKHLEEEINKLDSVIENVIDVLKNNLDHVEQCKELHNLYNFLSLGEKRENNQSILNENIENLQET